MARTFGKIKGARPAPSMNGAWNLAKRWPRVPPWPSFNAEDANYDETTPQEPYAWDQTK
jgi:hypothetical protein